MGIEIERKFLLSGESWRTHAVGCRYRQGYICTGAGRTVRVRTVEQKGYLTIKGPSTGPAKLEFEYEIPVEEADELLADLCETPLIDKMRYTVDYRGFTWEIDEFYGDNQGLLIAEIELDNLDQDVDLPDWVGEEVTGDHRYFNASLVKNPYAKWKDDK